jgi:hypothetical protein
LQKTCSSGAVNCRLQDGGGQSQRQTVLERETDFIGKAMAAPTLGGGSTTAKQRLDMTFQLKQKMLKAAGLADHVRVANRKIKFKKNFKNPKNSNKSKKLKIKKNKRKNYPKSQKKNIEK